MIAGECDKVHSFTFWYLLFGAHFLLPYGFHAISFLSFTLRGVPESGDSAGKKKPHYLILAN